MEELSVKRWCVFSGKVKVVNIGVCSKDVEFFLKDGVKDSDVVK